MITPKEFRKSEPKEPKIYSKAGYCTIHKKEKLEEDDHECCGCCCSGCEPEYTCPKCQDLHAIKHNAWFRKFGHLIAVSEGLIYPSVVEKGIIKRPPSDLLYMQYLHGGKPIKMGSWCKIGNDGFLKKTNKPWSPPMIVVS